MLGRYIAVTLLVLGGAMLVAPDNPTSATEADMTDAAAAPAAPDVNDATSHSVVSRGLASAVSVLPVEPAEGAAPDAERDTRALSLNDVDTPVAVAVEPQSAPAGRAIDRISQDAALAAALALPAESADLPSLEAPESIREASAGAETLALIAVAEGRAPAASTEPSEAQSASRSIPETLYVTGSRVNVRAGPSTDFGVVGSVAFGDAVELVEDIGDGWAEIRVADGSTGFMARRFLEY